ncbi:DUF2378 family protein [bacterium]|nr:DUF2378 family protein [bacterium]
MGKMKGTGWIGNMEYLEKIGGAAGMEKIKAALLPADRALIFNSPILSYTWLDYGAYIRMMLVADKVLGQGDYRIIKEATRHNARKDISGIYRVFFSLLTPRGIFKNTAKVWHQYFDTGEVAVEFPDDKAARLTLTEFLDIPLYHEIAQNAFIAEMLVISGAKNVIAKHPQCIARGDDHCIFEFTWE